MAIIESLLSRRSLIVGIGGTAAAGALAVSTAGQKQVQAFKQLLWKNRPGRHNVRLSTANVDDWAVQVGTKFRSSTGHTLKLADVRQFDHQGKRPSGLRDRPFVAGFEVIEGAGPMPDQLLLRVDHREGGTFDLFLTAAAPDKPLRRIAVFG
jgi:hypothetical protein